MIKRHQRGMTLSALIFIMFIGGIIALITFQAIPAYAEYQAILNVVDRIEKIDLRENIEIRKEFNKQISADFVSSIEGDDLIIERSDGKITIGFEYEREILSFSNLRLIADFKK